MVNITVGLESHFCRITTRSQIIEGGFFVLGLTMTCTVYPELNGQEEQTALSDDLCRAFGSRAVRSHGCEGMRATGQDKGNDLSLSWIPVKGDAGILERQARERQATGSEGVYGGKPLSELIPEAVTGRTTDALGAAIGVSGRLTKRTFWRGWRCWMRGRRRHQD